MKMNDKDIAAYKIAMALKTMQTIRLQENFFTNIVSTISDWPDESHPLEQKWNIIRPLLSTLHISIRKPIEKTEEYDDLDGMEILKRSEFRSCFNALCPKPHCTECGLCGHRKHDKHLCKCVRCGLEYTSDPDGPIHNVDTDCDVG